MTDLDRIVFGAIKHRKLESDRQCKTRCGLQRSNRTVVDDCQLESVIAAKMYPDVDSDDDLNRMYAIVEGQISEAVRAGPYFDLAWKHLFEGRAVPSLAREYGKDRSTVSRNLQKVKKYLLGLDVCEPSEHRLKEIA